MTCPQTPSNTLFFHLSHLTFKENIFFLPLHSNSLLCFPLLVSGTIGFMVCSTPGPSVDFRNPVNPIEKHAPHPKDSGRPALEPLKYYNTEVRSKESLLGN